MKMNEMYPSKWLKAEDFEEDEARTVTIAGVTMEEFEQNGKKEDKPVVTFKEEDKGLVLNKTNGNMIADMYGEDTDEWVGKQITLRTLEVESFGETVRAIRVKPKSKNPTKEIKNRTLKIEPGFDMNEFRETVCKNQPYYANKDGTPNAWHITNAILKLGHAELNSQNAEEIMFMLLQHALAEQAEKKA